MHSYILTWGPFGSSCFSAKRIDQYSTTKHRIYSLLHLGYSTTTHRIYSLLHLGYSTTKHKIYSLLYPGYSATKHRI